MLKMVRFVRLGYYALAWVFVACLMVQVFLAGLATFDSGDWKAHVSFVRTFAIIPILMIALSLLGRMSWRTVLITIGMFLMVIFQFISVKLDAKTITALHPVVAVLLIGFTIMAIRRSKPVKPSNGA
jgi:hypothetical protein